jgi:hypothetical protein
LRADLGAELDAIALKAIAKEKQGRYASLDALAADIRRYLAGEPVLAHPPSAAYQLRKFVSRHRLTVLLATIAFAVTLAAALIAGGMAIRLAQRQAQLVGAQERERSERLAAERARDNAASEADKVRATNAFLQTLLTTDDPLLNLRPDTRLRELLDEAGRALEAGVLADQPEVEASVRITIGRTYTSLKLPQQGEPHLRRALRIHEESAGRDGAGLAEACAQLGLCLSERRKFDEGIPLHRRALELRRALDPSDDAKLIDVLWRFSTALRDHRELAEAEALAREALDRSLRHFGQRHTVTAESRFRLGHILTRRRVVAEGERQLREALAIQQELLGPENPACGETKLRLGNNLGAQRQYGDAERLMREAISILEKSLGYDNPRVARAVADLAKHLLNRGADDEAESLWRENAQRAARYYGEQSANVAGALSQQAHVRGLRGDLAGAEALRREALELFQADLGEAHQYTRNERLALAELLVQQGCFAEAESLLLEAHANAVARSDTAVPADLAKIAGQLVQLYQGWSQSEPDSDRAAKAALWRARLGGLDHTNPASDAEP